MDGAEYGWLLTFGWQGEWVSWGRETQDPLATPAIEAPAVRIGENAAKSCRDAIQQCWPLQGVGLGGVDQFAGDDCSYGAAFEGAAVERRVA